MIRKKIIIFNGPPNSGKDHAVNYLALSQPKAVPQSFKQRLIDITLAIHGFTLEYFESIYTRELKDQPNEKFFGLSPRQALIKVSEEVIKPNYGRDYFGQAALSVVREEETYKENAVHCFSDGGFLEELRPLTNYFGESKILVIRLYRDGCSFKGDSRNYLHEADPVVTLDVLNNGTTQDFEAQLTDIFNAYC